MSTRDQRLEAKRAYLSTMQNGPKIETCIMCAKSYYISRLRSVNGWYKCPACCKKK